MSIFETWHDSSSRGTRIEGVLLDRDVFVDTGDIIKKVRQEIIYRLADQIMADIGPKLEAALKEALKQ